MCVSVCVCLCVCVFPVRPQKQNTKWEEVVRWSLQMGKGIYLTGLLLIVLTKAVADLKEARVTCGIFHQFNSVNSAVHDGRPLKSVRVVKTLGIRLVTDLTWENEPIVQVQGENGFLHNGREPINSPVHQSQIFFFSWRRTNGKRGRKLQLMQTRRDESDDLDDKSSEAWCLPKIFMRHLFGC